MLKPLSLSSQADKKCFGSYLQYMSRNMVCSDPGNHNSAWILCYTSILWKCFIACCCKFKCQRKSKNPDTNAHTHKAKLLSCHPQTSFPCCFFLQDPSGVCQSVVDLAHLSPVVFFLQMKAQSISSCWWGLGFAESMAANSSCAPIRKTWLSFLSCKLTHSSGPGWGGSWDWEVFAYFHQTEKDVQSHMSPWSHWCNARNINTSWVIKCY